MAPIPAAPQADPAQPSQQLQQELQQWLPLGLGVVHLLEVLSSFKRHTFFWEVTVHSMELSQAS